MSDATTDAAPAPFTMIGDPAAACEGDACLVPGFAAPETAADGGVTTPGR
ncbi:hypothetical protein [Agromyces arachidis]